MKKGCFAAAFLTAAATLGAAGEPARQPFPPIMVSDLNGQSYKLKDFLGAVTLVNFWATWCGPCRIELPEMQRLYNELGAKGLAVLAIDLDGPPMPEEGISGQLQMYKPRIEAFLAKAGITLPVYVIDGPTQISLGIDRLPFSVLLDREGNIVQVYPGYAPAVIEDLRKLALGLLSSRPSEGGK